MPTESHHHEFMLLILEEEKNVKRSLISKSVHLIFPSTEYK